MIVVDASVLVSAAWPSDVHHQVSRAWLQGYIRSATDLAVALQLRGADAVYVALAAKLSVPLITWDQEQLLRGGRRAITSEPTAQP